jgi:hypothetical protein
MAQRALDVYRAMPPADQAQVQAWLSSLGGERLLALDIPRLRLRGLRVMPEPAESRVLGVRQTAGPQRAAAGVASRRTNWCT